jgi:hypothetical protein
MSPDFYAAFVPAVFALMQAPTPNVAHIAVSINSEDNPAAPGGLATARKGP